MRRISREEMFMNIAHEVAKRASCQRLNVGAIIVRNNRIVSIGYNGTKPGEDHCSGETCPGWLGGCKRALHAEMNAIDYLPEGITTTNLELYCTDSPCEHCWERIEEDGRIHRAYFRTPYRIMDHLMRPSAVELYRVMPSGTVIDWRSNRIVRQ